MPREQYKKLKVKLLAAIFDEEGHVQDFVKEGLRNNRSYMERLHDLASIPGAEVVHRLLTDRTVWAKELKSARNGLTYATETPQDHDDALPAFRLLEISYALLCLVAMAELGLSPEVQARVLDYPRISEAAYQFKKVVTDLAETPVPATQTLRTD